MIKKEDKIITFLFMGNKAKEFINTWQGQILDDFNDLQGDSFDKYEVEFLQYDSLIEEDNKREYVLIIDLTDEEIGKAIDKVKNISIYSIINMYKEENDKNIKKLENIGNIYVKYDDSETLRRIIMMFMKVISPPVYMGDMFESVDLKNIISNRQLYVDNLSKDLSNKLNGSLFDRIVNKIQNEYNFREFSVIILLLYVGSNFSIFQMNDIMYEVHKKCKEDSEVMEFSAHSEKALLPDDIELLILKGL